MSTNLKKIAAVLILVTIASKILGLVREGILAYEYGTSYITDAYSIAITVPSTLFAIIMTGVSESYIPVYMQINDEELRKKFTNNIITIMVIISTIILILGLLFIKPISFILAPGFPNEYRNILIQFIAIILFSLPISAFYEIYIGYLRSREHFIIVNVTKDIINNILIIFTIFLAANFTDGLLASGYVIVSFICLIIIILFTYIKTSYRYKFVFDIKEPNLRKIIVIGIPLGLSFFANHINALIDKLLASLCGEGVISSLAYANKIELLFYTVSIYVFITVSFPRMSKAFAENDYKKGGGYVRTGVMMTNYLGIPVTMFLMIFSKEVVSLIFERGEFGKESTLITSQCLVFYSIGIIFYCYREIFSRALVACNRQRKIMKNTLLAIAFNIIFSTITVWNLQHIGLALGTSLAGVIASWFMYKDVKKNNIFQVSKYDVKELAIVFISSIIAISVSKIIFSLNFRIDWRVSFILVSLLFALVFILSSYLMKSEVIRYYIRKGE